MVTGHPYTIRTPRYILDDLLFIIEIDNHDTSWHDVSCDDTHSSKLTNAFPC